MAQYRPPDTLTEAAAHPYTAERHLEMHFILLLAGFLLTPLFGVGTINQSNFSLPSLLLSLLGAIILLAMVDFIHRGTVR
jgi:hypothetical protein